MIWPRRSLTAIVSGTLMDPAAAWTMFSTSSWVRRFESGAETGGGTALEFVPLPQEMIARLRARHRAYAARVPVRRLKGNVRARHGTARVSA